MEAWQRDKQYADRFMPLVRSILRKQPRIVEDPTIEQDQKEATDLIILHSGDIRIACRMRRPGYLERWPNDFTIRAARRSGTKTELSKLCEGFGDWMFYGHGSDESADPKLMAWYLIDLNVFREYVKFNPPRAEAFGRLIFNKDNETCFMAYNVQKFQDRLVLDSFPGGQAQKGQMALLAPPPALPS